MSLHPDRALLEVLRAWIDFVWRARSRGLRLDDPLEPTLASWPTLTREDFGQRLAAASGIELCNSLRSSLAACKAGAGSVLPKKR